MLASAAAWWAGITALAFIFCQGQWRIAWGVSAGAFFLLLFYVANHHAWHFATHSVASCPIPY